MEDDLDRIKEGEINAIDVLETFYGSFRKELEQAAEEMHSVKGHGLPVDLNCPSCDQPLRIKVGKSGPFLACSAYPKCDFTGNYTRNETGQIEIQQPAVDQPSDEICEKCESPMVQKQGRFGPFLACSSYPDCKNTRSLKARGASKTEPTGVKCPEKGCDGDLVSRRSKRGRLFYGCSRYPNCTFAVWNKPVPQSCPECRASFLLEHTTKKDGPHLKCFNKECTYKKLLEGNHTS